MTFFSWQTCRFSI